MGIITRYRYHRYIPSGLPELCERRMSSRIRTCEGIGLIRPMACRLPLCICSHTHIENLSVDILTFSTQNGEYDQLDLHRASCMVRGTEALLSISGFVKDRLQRGLDPRGIFRTAGFPVRDRIDYVVILHQFQDFVNKKIEVFQVSRLRFGDWIRLTRLLYTKFNDL